MIVLAVSFLGLFAFGQSRETTSATGVSDYDLTWHTVDGGGAMLSNGGDFLLSGTIGQPDPGDLTGGEFTLVGGFWFALVPGDIDGDAGITLDDYEYYTDCMAGEGAEPPAGCVVFDSDGDDDIDLLDFRDFQNRFGGS